MKVGVIGHKNHATKIINILADQKNIKKIKIFLYKKYNKQNLNLKSKKIEYVYSINDLFDTCSIFISSPTKTHKKYIKLFLNTKIYIFCEKPGGNGIIDLNFLRKIKTNRKGEIYFNYNFLFTKQIEFIKKMIQNKKVYGDLSFIELKLTNGISFKEEFSNNWRFKSKNIFDQIAGNVGSHYINLLIWLFKSVKKKNILKLSVNKKNDTSLIVLKAGKSVLVNMYFSYSNHLSDKFNLFFSNSILRIKDNKIIILKLKDYFDKNKNFVSPPILLTEKLNQTYEYLSSLEKSIKFFLYKVENNKKFSSKYFNNSLDTLKFFI